ncbi:MAG TPA: alpha/beta fold hydrolase [Candidatus Acidoferrales bacterium]|nr:alpha/beta fold hydrolase [Candidatus Acidoferrales bacterium]
MTAIAWMRRLVLVPVLAYLAVIVLLLAFERRLVFFPQIPSRLTGDWSPPDLAHEDVWLTAGDGVRLHGWWIPAQAKSLASEGGPSPAGARGGAGDLPTFLCFHGNAANIAWRADFYRFLRGLPASVFALEYRGYGRSEGAASEQGIYRDADAAYSYLVRERGIPPRRIIALGQSLGTAVAAELAARRELGGVVLEAPFPSARALARRIYWFVPGLGWLIRSRFETSQNLERASHNFPAPLLVIHCTRDPVIPFAFGKEVYDRAPEPKSFLAVSGECHEEATLVDPEGVKHALLVFAEQVRAGQPPPRP